MEKLILDKVDGRTISGARQAVKRMLGLSKRRHGKSGSEPKGVDLVQGGLLQNFMIIVDAAIMLQPTSLQRLAKPDLEKYIALMVKEGLDWPAEIQIAILSRKATELTIAGDLHGLVRVMNPWLAPMAFDPFSPTLAALSLLEDDKLFQFSEAIFRKLIPDLIAKGEQSKTQVLQIAEDTLDLIGKVDRIRMVETCALELAAIEDIAQALLAITTETVDLEYEVATLGVSGGVKLANRR